MKARISIAAALAVLATLAVWGVPALLHEGALLRALLTAFITGLAGAFVGWFTAWLRAPRKATVPGIEPAPEEDC